MLEQIAMLIGYGVMGLVGIGITLALLYVAITWYEWHVLMPRLKFDGKGNIIKK